MCVTFKHFCPFLCTQSIPSCSIPIPASLQGLPRLCPSWCSEDSPESSSDNASKQQTTNFSHASARVHHPKKMPFRKKNWCGCVQVSSIKKKRKKYSAKNSIFYEFKIENRVSEREIKNAKCQSSGGATASERE